MNYVIRENPKFIFLRDEIEKYVSNGGKVGRIFLCDNENRRCPLGIVGYNHSIPENEIVDNVFKEFNLSIQIAYGFDHRTRFSENLSPRVDLSTKRVFSENERIDWLIGQEIAIYCIEKGFYDSKRY